MSPTVNRIAWVLAMLLLSIGIAGSAEPQWKEPISQVTVYTHQGGPDETRHIAKALALFGAKQEACRELRRLAPRFQQGKLAAGDLAGP